MNKKLNIKFAPQNQIVELEPWVDKILEAIGHPEAWISDRSSLDDFLLSDERIYDIEKELGINIDPEDINYIVDLARRLKEENKS